MERLIHTIGYGGRSFPHLVERLRRNGIDFVLDVRSRPASRQPGFAKAELATALRAEGIGYGYLGRELGGKPDDPACVGPDGRVDYARCAARPAFAEGLARVENGVAQGRGLALLCAELDADRCHRTHLLAPALLARGVRVLHIDREGGAEPHARVLARAGGEQGELFSQ